MIFCPHLTQLLRRIQHNLIWYLLFLEIPYLFCNKRSLCYPATIFYKCKINMSLSCLEHIRASHHTLKVYSFLTMAHKAAHGVSLPTPPAHLWSSLCIHSGPGTVTFCDSNTSTLSLVRVMHLCSSPSSSLPSELPRLAPSHYSLCCSDITSEFKDASLKPLPCYTYYILVPSRHL